MLFLCSSVFIRDEGWSEEDFQWRHSGSVGDQRPASVEASAVRRGLPAHHRAGSFTTFTSFQPPTASPLVQFLKNPSPQNINIYFMFV